VPNIFGPICVSFLLLYTSLQMKGKKEEKNKVSP